jgi:hypothetical protein
VAAVLLLATVGAVTSFGPGWGLLAVLLLMMATGDALLPTRFELGPDGVRVDHPFRRARRGWDAYGGWRPATDGFWLARRGPLRARGLLIRCPGREDEVEAGLRAWMGAPQ